MLFCRQCGQCSYISDEHFIEYASISGTETRYLSPDTGDVEDYGDTNTDSTGDSDYECPTCGHSRIDFDWEPDSEEEGKKEALALRESWEAVTAVQRAQREQQYKNDKVKSSDWDLETN